MTDKNIMLAMLVFHVNTELSFASGCIWLIDVDTEYIKQTKVKSIRYKLIESARWVGILRTSRVF